MLYPGTEPIETSQKVLSLCWCTYKPHTTPLPASWMVLLLLVLPLCSTPSGSGPLLPLCCNSCIKSSYQKFLLKPRYVSRTWEGLPFLAWSSGVYNTHSIMLSRAFCWWDTAIGNQESSAVHLSFESYALTGLDSLMCSKALCLSEPLQVIWVGFGSCPCKLSQDVALEMQKETNLQRECGWSDIWTAK